LAERTQEFVDILLSRDAKILVRTKTLVDGMTGKEISEADELETAYLDEWLREREA